MRWVSLHMQNTPPHPCLVTLGFFLFSVSSFGRHPKFSSFTGGAENRNVKSGTRPSRVRGTWIPGDHCERTQSCESLNRTHSDRRDVHDFRLQNYLVFSTVEPNEYHLPTSSMKQIYLSHAHTHTKKTPLLNNAFTLASVSLFIKTVRNFGPVTYSNISCLICRLGWWVGGETGMPYPRNQTLATEAICEGVMKVNGSQSY